MRMKLKKYSSVLLLLLGFGFSSLAQNLERDLKRHNSILDSMGNYTVKLHTTTLRNGKVIENESLTLSKSANNYNLTSQYANTYNTAEYQLIEDKMNKIYYVGLGDSSMFSKGLTGRVQDSILASMLSHTKKELDSVYVYKILYLKEGKRDSITYHISKRTHLVEKAVFLIPDEEEHHRGESDLLKNNYVLMQISYKYHPYKGGKLLNDLVQVNGEKVSLKSTAKKWQLVNMIPMQKQILKQKKVKKMQKKNQKRK